MTKLIYLLVAIATLIAFQVPAAAQQPGCMTVNMASSAASNNSVSAIASVVNCFPANAQLLDISLSVTSSDNAVASPPGNPIPISEPNSLVGTQISIRSVASCTPVTITFSMRAAGNTITVTKTLMVCPFSFDIGVSGVSVTPAAAGQLSDVAVTIFNQGAETLFTNSYRVELSTQENTTGMVRNSCGGPGPPVSVSGPDLPNILPGEQQTVMLNFRFPQGGNLTLNASASIGGAEDGPSSNNTRGQSVVVPLPLPLICGVTPANANPGETVTINGNWFVPFGSSAVPTVQFGDEAAQNVQVTSPLQITARISRASCLNESVRVTVTNSTGSTSAGGPVVGASPLEITRIDRRRRVLIIRLANFRPNCPFRVRLLVPGLGTVAAQVRSRGHNYIVINRLLGASYFEIQIPIRTVIEVRTPNGTATMRV